MSDEQRQRNLIVSRQLGLMRDGDEVDYDGQLPVVLAAAGVPGALVNARLSDLGDSAETEIKEALISWRDGSTHPPSVGLSILGGARIGKSTAGAAVLRWFARRNYSVAWVRVDDLLADAHDNVRGTHGFDSEEFTDRRWLLSRVYDAVVLDGITWTTLSDFTAGIVLSIVKSRADFGTYTVITGPELPTTMRSAARRYGKAETDAPALNAPFTPLTDYVAAAYHEVGRVEG